jgi:hypothetical protein
MIIACYNVFNEARHLEESLKSLRDKVDLIVVVDGAYKKFAHKNSFSTDGTLEIAKRYADHLFLMAEVSEIEKRNRYLIGIPGDVYIQVDGHEIWRGEIDPTIMGNWRVKVKMGDGWHVFDKMFRHYNGIHYKKHHYQLFVGDKPLNIGQSEYPLGYFEHYDDVSEERQRAKENYYSLPNFDN